MASAPTRRSPATEAWRGAPRGNHRGVKFMVFMYLDRSVELSADERSAIPEAVEAWATEMDERGVRLEGDVLGPASEAATVRVRDGEILRGHGAHSDGSAAITGFNIIDCADVNEALEVAARHPVATFGVLEIRPFSD